MKPIKALILHYNKTLTECKIYKLIIPSLSVKIELGIIKPHDYIRTIRMEIYDQIEKKL